jgi:RNA-directed DNA polymerase
LQGKLAFIEQIEEQNRQIHSHQHPIVSSGHGRERLYRRFLFFNAFYNAKTPIIVCEGKTDNVYLVHAIRSLAALYPQLATKDADGTIKLTVRILKYFAKSTGKILGMHGGVDGLKNFINQYYDDMTRRFKAPGAKQPVIVLIDNDKGSKEIYKTAAKITKKTPSGTEPFIYISNNLYIVPTPKLASGQDSQIEDCFDQATLDMSVEGKVFDPGKDIDTATHIGKAAFAHKVVKANADKIDFTGFKQLLDNVVLAISAHAKKHGPALPT